MWSFSQDSLQAVPSKAAFFCVEMMLRNLETCRYLLPIISIKWMEKKNKVVKVIVIKK